MAQQSEATVAPVGLAWELARKRRPDIALYANDGSHPSKLGAYLTACVFYSTLTKKTATGLPANPKAPKKDGSLIELITIDATDATFLQSIADEILNSYTQPTQPQR